MAKSREHFALDWIKGELLETLNGAREALEAFVESDRDETRMRACLTGLHQVHGTLVMLELAGVTLLADHLEQLAQKMLTADVVDEHAAAQVLMQGILELPGHLEEIQAGGSDSVRVVG
ncbi:MAG: Hpt domain-containing protein, partial [Pseudomonadales bacterium]